MADLLDLQIGAVACPLGAVICHEDSRTPMARDLDSSLCVAEEVRQRC